MPRSRGRSLKLSLGRSLVCDLLHFARKVPTVPVQRQMQLAEVRDARDSCRPRPSWCALFLKAYGIVASRTPEFRRAYLSFPWSRLYEHPLNVASVAVERELADEAAVLCAKINRPEQKSLLQLDAQLRHFKNAPVEELGHFRHQLRLTRWPRPVRRFLWWLTLDALGAVRAQKAGTFAVSVYAGLGAASLHPLTPLTTTLNYGVLQPDGSMEVRIIYDHRVMDGAIVARALAELERVLREEILSELQQAKPLAA